MPKAIEVRRYKNEKEYQKDAGKWAKRGYNVLHVVSEQPRSGCARIVMLGGIGALFFKPKPVFVVTYQRM
jgi:hypothetical protein